MISKFWLVVFLFGLFVIQACDFTKKSVKVTDNNNEPNNRNIEVAPKPEPAIAPIKLDAEVDRYENEDGSIHIDVSGSGYKKKDEFTLLQKMFPGIKKQIAMENESFTAYNFRHNSKKLNAVIMYEQFESGWQVSFIMLSEGDFDITLIEHLFD